MKARLKKGLEPRIRKTAVKTQQAIKTKTSSSCDNFGLKGFAAPAAAYTVTHNCLVIIKEGERGELFRGKRFGERAAENFDITHLI